MNPTLMIIAACLAPISWLLLVLLHAGDKWFKEEMDRHYNRGLSARRLPWYHRPMWGRLTREMHNRWDANARHKALLKEWDACHGR